MASTPDFSNLGFSSNPYMQQQVSDSLDNMTRAWNNTQQPAFNSAMVNSGSFGNQGLSQMNSDAARNFQLSLGQTANNMLSNNFWNGMQFDNQNYWNNNNFNKNVYDTTFNQNQQNFQNGLNLLQMQNSANQQNLGFGTTIQNTPMNYYGNFAQQANSIGQGYGTNTGTMSASGSPVMGALGGAQLGNGIAKNMGWGTDNYNTWQSSPMSSTIYSNGSLGD